MFGEYHDEEMTKLKSVDLDFLENNLFEYG